MLALGQAISFHRYGHPLVTGNGYAFLAYLSPDWRYKVARVNLTTGARAVLDFGPTPYNDLHFYQTLAIDPTDNKLVVIAMGRYGQTSGVDHRANLRKSDYAFGGTDEQWTTDNFTGPVEFPYPSSGQLGYTNAVFGPDGSLYILGSHTNAHAHPTFGYSEGSDGTLMYRYIGNGEPKTASQLATGGSWHYPIQGTPDADGRIYINHVLYQDSALHIAYSYQEATIGGVNTSPRRGLAYLRIENLGGTMVGKRVDGETVTLPVANNTPAKNSPLFSHNAYGDYYGTVAFVDGYPILTAPRWTLDGNYAITSRWLERYTWDGEWVAETLHPTSDAYGYAFGSDVYRPLGTTTVKTDLAGTDTLVTSPALSLVRVADSSEGLVYAGINAGQLLFGPTVAEEGDCDLFLEQPSAFDGDLFLPEVPYSVYVFEDDFNRANGAVGNGWTAGNTIINNNQLLCPDNSGVIHRPLPDGAYLDIEADLWAGSTDGIINANTYHGIGFTNSAVPTTRLIFVSRTRGGAIRIYASATQLATTGNGVYDDTTPVRVRCQILGDTINAYADGVLILSAADTTIDRDTLDTIWLRAQGFTIANYGYIDNFGLYGDLTGSVLTYHANGGDNPPLPQSGSDTYTVSGIGSMERTGWVFVSWNTLPDGSGTGYLPDDEITLESPLTLYAIWTIRIPEPIWCDTFDRANSSTVGNGWTQNTSAGVTYGVQGNRLSLAQPTATATSFSVWRAFEGGLQNEAITCDLTGFAQANTNGRVYLGFGGAGAPISGYTGYTIRANGNGSLSLQRATSGTLVTLGSATVTLTAESSLGLERDGTTLTAYHNGVAVITATDSNHGSLTHVSAALWANAGTTSVDNLCIWEAQDYPPPAPQPVTTRRHRVISGGF